MNTLGERLRQGRQKLNLTQEELASRAGISKGFLSEVENNARNLSAENLMKLARELGVTLDYLMKGVGTSEVPEHKSVEFPESLARFATDEGLQFDVAMTLLGMKRQVVARRRDARETDLETFDWKSFYQSVKDYL